MADYDDLTPSVKSFLIELPLAFDHIADSIAWFAKALICCVCIVSVTYSWNMARERKHELELSKNK